jgi:hypothetical protein
VPQLEPLQLDHMANSPRKPLCHSTPSLATRKPHQMPHQNMPPPQQLPEKHYQKPQPEFQTRNYGWLDGGLDGGKENQPETRHHRGGVAYNHAGARKTGLTTAASMDDFSSSTLPRSMRFRSASGSRSSCRFGGSSAVAERKGRFETKDYGWVDGGQIVPLTNMHPNEAAEAEDESAGRFVRNSQVYATGTLPRGRKVSFL